MKSVIFGLLLIVGAQSAMASQLDGTWKFENVTCSSGSTAKGTVDANFSYELQFTFNNAEFSSAVKMESFDSKVCQFNTRGTYIDSGKDISVFIIDDVSTCPQHARSSSFKGAYTVIGDLMKLSVAGEPGVCPQGELVVNVFSRVK